ncbi:MAG TPA: glycerophosphodiester phosphodiesterase family protein [Gammaproteobacteria bacterium]|nr:glycerophosphodiester phosphodiesterase family protein [Gammaproteobacteria bacterium]
MNQSGNPALVAHRGYPLRYPENSLSGIEAAIRAGARHVEFDLQLSRDRVPVLCHDADLVRTAGRNVRVMDLTATELDTVDVGEPTRFGTRFRATPLPRLSSVLTLLAAESSDVHAFIEIKQESIAHFGLAPVTEAVMAELHACPVNATVISFNAECVERMRTLGAPSIGWVTEERAETTASVSARLRPDFLFTSLECFPMLYPACTGNWQWAVYHTEDPELARSLLQQGAALVETNAIAEMLAACRTRASR